MANLTITVDEETVKRARIRALEEGTSVNAILRSYLEEYSGVRREKMEAWREIQELARSSGMSSGGNKCSFTLTVCPSLLESDLFGGSPRSTIAVLNMTLRPMIA